MVNLIEAQRLPINFQHDAGDAGGPLPDMHPQAPEYLRKPFSELNIFVTGGNRDVGKGIVDAALEGGAKHIASTFRRGSQKRRSVEPMQAYATATYDADLSFTQCDLTTEEGLQAVFQEWETRFNNEVDVLVLNTSGPGPAINVVAAQRLTDRFLDIRRQRQEAGAILPEATIVLMQSVPSLFNDQIEGAVEFTDFYRDVAPHKLEGQRQLEARQEELDTPGVRYMVVTPPEVPDTLNMDAFEKMDPLVRQKSEDLSRMLGLPLTTPTHEVGQKVVALLKRDDVPQGHLELFADTQDAKKIFGDIYGDNAIYLTTVDAKAGKGYLIVNPSIHGEEPEIPTQGGVSYNNDGTVEISLTEDIRKEHMRGHFRDELGVAVFPGHKSLRQIAESGEIAIQGKYDSQSSYRIQGYDSIKFQNPILPDTVMDLAATLDTDETLSAIVTVNNKPAVSVSGLRFVEVSADDPKDVLFEDQLLEGAAQTFGAHILDGQQDKDIVPLFMSTGPAEFTTPVQTGDSIVFYAEKTRTARSIHQGNVRIIRQTFAGEGKERHVVEEEIGSIQQIRLVILPRKQAMDALSKAS